MSENHWENHVSTPVPPDCGLDVDGARLWLWLQVKHWAGIAPGTCNPCIEVAANKWALLSGGASGGKRTYLLVPTERKKGIECPEIWEHSDPNYWNGAWGYVQRYMTAASTGLGINSAYARTQDQLHIHMAAFQAEAKQYLDKNFGQIATKPGDWANKILSVPGRDEHGTLQVRSYRALFVRDLTTDNLFYLVRNFLVPPEQMGNQTVIVIPTSAPSPPGFYVLNSETALDKNNGTSTCDFLLACK